MAIEAENIMSTRVYKSEMIKKVQSKLTKVMFERQENNLLHNSFEWGEQVYDSIKNGDYEGVFKSAKNTENYEIGIKAEDSLRSQKDSVICFFSVLNYRLCKERILDTETAYSLSDACIQLLEHAANEKVVAVVIEAGIFEYIEQIQNQKKINYHNIVKQAKDYIFKNLHSKIIICEMANQLAVNASYLSQLFRKYEGMTIQQYIQSERLTRAKKLLKYSDYSTEEISQYLGFPSQSYLGLLLKQKEGMTPMMYRKTFNDNYRNKMK